MTRKVFEELPSVYKNPPPVLRSGLFVEKVISGVSLPAYRCNARTSAFFFKMIGYKLTPLRKPIGVAKP